LMVHWEEARVACSIAFITLVRKDG
jgi:hypothetical protein